MPHPPRNAAFAAQFAARLQQAMDAQGLTAYGLHLRTTEHGTPMATGNLAKYLRCERIPTLDTAVNLAKALGCTVNDLVKEEK